jgi:hypothetical protein
MQFTLNLQNSPPNYDYIGVEGFNCATAAIATTKRVGLTGIPNDISPQTFGVDLHAWYPGDWISTNAYYDSGYNGW